jgi:hypothetical protein
MWVRKLINPAHLNARFRVAERMLGPRYSDACAVNISQSFQIFNTAKIARLGWLTEKGTISCVGKKNIVRAAHLFRFCF